MKCAKMILFFTNTLLFVLGAGAAGVAGYMLQFNSDFSDVVPTFITQIALITAVSVMVIALVACVAAANYTKGWAKFMLLCYAFMLFLVMAIMLGAGVMVFLKQGELEACETADFGTTDCPDSQHLLRHFSNSTRTQCCTNRDDPACVWVESIVSDVSCSRDDVWRSSLFRLVNDKLKPVGYFVVVVAVIELVTIFATCYLMTQHDEHLVHPTTGMDSLPKQHTDPPSMTKSKAVLIVVNFILLLLGGAMLGFSAYILKFNTNVSEVMSSGGPAIAMATGAAIIVLALFGCVGACNHGKGWAKCLLIIYDLVLIIVILVEVLGAAMMILSMNNIASCRDSPLGSDQCEDSQQAFVKFINDTKNSCCYPVSRRTTSECSWAATVLTDSTCASFDDFKGALLDFVSERMIPVSVVVLLIALVQLVTCCSTCCLIKSKGKAVMSGRPASFYGKGATPSFYYGGQTQMTNRTAPASGGAASAASEWATATDGQGRVYYYHKVTRETRWDPPPGLVV